MTLHLSLPRFVAAKRLKAGPLAFYWAPPAYWQRQAAALGKRWPFESVKLGEDLSQAELEAAARPHNLQFDDWREGGGNAALGPIRRYAAHGSIAWLLETYLESEIFRRRVAERSRADYRRIFDQVIAYPLPAGGTLGALPVASVTPAAAEKLYAFVIKGGALRQGEKAVMYLKTAWRLMQPHHPAEFRKDVPNPFAAVQLVSRTRKAKAAHSREDVYAFAAKALELGLAELAAAAIVCFEWLQRPENVLGGYVRWPDYQPGLSIRVQHHKTGAAVTHPLCDADGTPFYPDAEAVLARCEKRGIPIVLRRDGTLYEPTRAAQVVRVIADAAALPRTFSLDACRHGGMTELEEAGLTDGQGRALSAHRSRAYDGYAKRTRERLLAATRRRSAYLRGEG